MSAGERILYLFTCTTQVDCIHWTSLNWWECRCANLVSWLHCGDERHLALVELLRCSVVIATYSLAPSVFVSGFFHSCDRSFFQL